MYTRIQLTLIAISALSLISPQASAKMSDIKPLELEGGPQHKSGSLDSAGSKNQKNQTGAQQIIAQVGETIIHILGPCGAEPACLAAAPENNGNSDFASSVTNHAPNVGDKTVPTPAGPQTGALNAVYYWSDAEGNLQTLDQPMFANREYQSLTVNIRNGTNPNPRHSITVTGPNGEAIDLVNFGGLEGGVTKSVQLGGITGNVTFQCQVHQELAQNVAMVTPENGDIQKDKQFQNLGPSNEGTTVFHSSPVHQFMNALNDLVSKVQAFVG